MCMFTYETGKRHEVKQPPKFTLDDEDIEHEFFGWKSWHVMGGKLTSYYMYKYWDPGKPMKGRNITSDGKKGVYSYKTPLEAAITSGRVFGEVALWGTVWEYDNGFCSSMAIPTLLFVESVQTAASLSVAYSPVGLRINIDKRKFSSTDIGTKVGPITYVPYNY